MGKISRKIRKAFENATPDVLNSVLSNCNFEEKPESKKKFRVKQFLATAAAVALLFGVGYAAADIVGNLNFTSTSQNANLSFISSEKAKEIAASDMLYIEMRDIIEITNASITMVGQNEVPCYHVDLSFDGATYTYVIDAATGQIKNLWVLSDRSAVRGEQISWRSARDAALDHAGVELEHLTSFLIEYKEDSRLYELKFRDQIHAYSYKIDGYSGKVLELERKNDDDCDPVPSMYTSRHESIKFVLGCANVSYDDVSFLESSSDYDSDPKTRTVNFTANDIDYNYTLRMTSLSIISSRVESPPTQIIPATDAIGAALKANGISYSTVSDLSCSLTHIYLQTSSEGLPIWLVSFTSIKDKFDVSVDVVTGNVLNTFKQSNIIPDYGNDVAVPYLCTNAALDAAGIKKENVQSLSTYYEEDSGQYRVTFLTYDHSFTYLVDAVTKLAQAVTPPALITIPDKQIGTEAAITAAIEHAQIQRSYVMYEHAQIEDNDGEWYYEVKFYHSGYFYTYEINLTSAEVLHWEKEEEQSVDMTISEEDSRGIRYKFLELFAGEDSETNYTVDDLSLQNFGVYDGAMIVLIVGFETGSIDTEYVASLAFQYADGQRLYALYEDQILGLGEAYDYGLLDYEDIATIHLYFMTI